MKSDIARGEYAAATRAGRAGVAADMRVGFHLGHPRQPASRSKPCSPTSSGTNVDRIVCLGDICFGPQAHECLAARARARLPGHPRQLGLLVDRGLPAGRRPGRDDALRDRRAGGRKLLTDEDRAFVRDVRADARRRRSSDGSRMHLLPRLAEVVLRLDLLDDARRRPRADVRRDRRRRARRRPHAPADAAPLRPAGDRQPGQRRPAVQPVVAEDDPRRATGPSTASSTSSDGWLQIDLRRVPCDVDALLRFCRESGMPHAQWWIDSWNPA